jgi:trigger factor
MNLQTPELQINVQKPRAWSRRLTITIPAERVQAERQQEVQRLSRQVRLPGFRKGKVPPQVVERQFGSLIDQQALDRLVNEAFKEALEREQLQPISQGEVENVDYQPGSALTFDVEFEVRPEIELERIGGFTVQQTKPAITDEEVESVLERVRQQHATWNGVESGTPLDGDRVVVEITPLEGAEAERGGGPRQYEVIIGEEQALPPVEAAIRTLEPGKEEEFALELPDPDAEEEGATREERLRIRLVELSRAELPALDDEFAKSVGAFETVEALRARIRTDLEEEAEGEAERGVRRELLDQILEANPFEVPDTMINRYLDQLLPARRDEDLEKRSEMRQMARPAAEQALRRMMVIERVAELEGLHATSAEVDERVEEIAARNERPVAEVWTQLQKSGRMAALEEEITENKVFQYLKSQSTIE